MPRRPRAPLRFPGLAFLAAVATGTVQETKVDTYYVTKLLDQFQKYSAEHLQASDLKHMQREASLKAGIESATALEDKRILEVTAAANEESRLEAQNAYLEMINFATTLKQALGAQGGASSCEDLSCGTNAYCETSLTQGAQCLCNEGWEGNGFVCNLPAETMAQPIALLQAVPNQPRPQTADMSVVVLDDGRAVVGYRSISSGESGYLMVGDVGPATVTWGTPTSFSKGSSAFGPALAALPGGRVAVAFRDRNRDGSGLLLAAKAQVGGKLVLGSPKVFTRRQARQMALMPLPDGHLAVIFADHVTGKVNGKDLASSRGAALLARFPGEALEPELMGKYRFVDAPVARFSMAQLTPSSFVVAYREAPHPGAKQRAEASVAWGQLVGNQLVFDPHPLSLEPDKAQMWARGVAPLTEDLFAYVYHSGDEQVTKQAVIHVDPKTHRMSVADGPRTIERGFTPILGAVGAPTVRQSGEGSSLLSTGTGTLRTFSFYAAPEDEASKARGRVCSVDGSGRMGDCREVNWAASEPTSAATTVLQDGRALIVFADTRGMPSYQFLGVFA